MNRIADARAILGSDFISSDEVSTHRLAAYTHEQHEELIRTVPSDEVLLWCKKNGYAVIPAPPTAMSLLDILGTQFDELRESDRNQNFVREDRTSPGWLMVKKTPVANSTSKNWHVQKKLLGELEAVPNVAEMCWFIFLYFAVRGERLFEGVYVRTSSLDWEGDRVRIGGLLDGENLNVRCCRDALRYNHVGLSATRKVA